MGEPQGKKRWEMVIASAIALGVAGLFLSLFYLVPDTAGGWLHLIERKILDTHFKKGAQTIKQNPSIIIVTINDHALQEMEPKYGRWPWTRRAMGEIVEYLHHSGVRAIGIDILYPEVNLNDPAGDKFLAKQVEAAGNVLLAANLPDNGEDLLPFAPLDKVSAGLGGVDFTADPDGPTRRYRLFYPRPKQIYPGLALAVAQYLKTPIEWDKVHLDRRNSTLIDWYGPQGQFPYVEASTLLNAYQEWKKGGGTLHKEASRFLKDKIVIVGVTATGLFDLRANPFSPIYPGIEIHATALSNLLEGHFIQLIPARWNVLSVLFLALVAGIVGNLLRSPLQESLFALGVIALVAFVGNRSFAAGYWIPTALPLLTVLTIIMATLFWHYLTTGREKRFIRHAFSRYINKEVLDELLANPQKLKLGGENIHMTVLFSDIRNFTSLSENLPPDEVVSLLNEYLTEMVDIVFQYEGTLDKFIGDAVMAFWGAPVKTEDHAEKGVRAALSMLEKVQEIRARWEKEGKPSLRIGVGINTAEMTVGNIGSERSQSYTVIGDGVNLASRLESLNKTYGTQLIVSESTYESIKEKFVGRFLDEVKVKGKEKSVKVYEITG